MAQEKDKINQTMLSDVVIIINRLCKEAVVEIHRRIPVDEEYHAALHGKDYNKFMSAAETLVGIVKNSGTPTETVAQKDAKAVPLQIIINCIKEMKEIHGSLKSGGSLLDDKIKLIRQISEELSNVENAPFHHKYWYKVVSLIKELAWKCGLVAEWTKHKPYEGPIKSEFWATKNLKAAETPVENEQQKPPSK
jgi:hypothetical protein